MSRSRPANQNAERTRTSSETFSEDASRDSALSNHWRQEGLGKTMDVSDDPRLRAPASVFRRPGEASHDGRPATGALLTSALLTALFAALLVVAPSAARIELKEFSPGSWQDLRLTHAAHAAIVHFWGTTCESCLAELPQWGQLAREERNLDLVLVDADPVAGDPAAIASLVVKAGVASKENWVFAEGLFETLWSEVDPTWAGEMPFTVLVSPMGEATTISGPVDFAAVRAWVAAQKSPRRAEITMTRENRPQ
jgi:thiol-disulfide isomerase/thioredoxin